MVSVEAGSIWHWVIINQKHYSPVKGLGLERFGRLSVLSVKSGSDNLTSWS